MANFNIKRPSAEEARSLIIPFIAPYGLAVEHLSTDPTQAAKAHNEFYGFLTRNVTATGPAIGDFIMPNQLETDVKLGEAVTVVDALELEVEGVDRVMTSGGQLINAETAVGTELSFESGRFCVTEASHVPRFQVVAHLTPEDSNNTTRILAVRI